ncbi:MAG: hypothetical protein LBD80_08150 [Tannerella sp.]|nr:hypothetical protein [Tannerella sp.]
MRKTGIYPNRKPVLKTGKAIQTGSKPTGLPSNSLCRRFHLHRQMTNCVLTTVSPSVKVIPANTKVNKANTKSTGLTPNPACGISFALANGKLCFEYLKTFSVPENHLPRRFMLRGKNRAPKSAVSDRKFSNFK